MPKTCSYFAADLCQLWDAAVKTPKIIRFEGDKFGDLLSSEHDKKGGNVWEN